MFIDFLNYIIGLFFFYKKKDANKNPLDFKSVYCLQTSVYIMQYIHMLELFLTPCVSMLHHFYAVCTGCTKANFFNPFVLMLEPVQTQVRNLPRYLFTVSDSHLVETGYKIMQKLSCLVVLDPISMNS